jgi:predicted Fe-Mo cluster-binding NifX family protein
MKYAVTSTGNTLESAIDRRFGRCAFIVTFETDTKAMEFFPNPFKNEDEGAGQALAAMLFEKGVQKVISGSFGIRIKDFMDSRKIQMIIPREGDHTVASVIDLIKQR